MHCIVRSNHIWPWNCPFDVDDHIKMYDLYLDLFVKNHIFDYPT